MEIRQVTGKELLAATRLVYPGLPQAKRPARKVIETAPQQLGIDFQRMSFRPDGARPCCGRNLTAGANCPMSGQ